MSDTYDPIEALRRQDTTALYVMFGPDWMGALAERLSTEYSKLYKEAYDEGYAEGHNDGESTAEIEFEAGYDQGVADIRDGKVPESYIPTAHLKR